MSTEEVPHETATVTTENFLQLSCFISMQVKYMQSGLKSKMMEPLVKKSETLGRDAHYIRTYLVSRLPAYLTVQFVRFQYKGKEGINAKVLKDIKFPIDFDAFELCTPELQKKLCPMRSKFKELEDKSMDLKIAKPYGVKDEDLETKYEQFWFDDDLGSNNSGYYTLQAVLTHKGRSSSSGHYVAWVRSNDDIWFKFDDDEVTSVPTDEILRLSGGGDWLCGSRSHLNRRLPRSIGSKHVPNVPVRKDITNLSKLKKTAQEEGLHEDKIEEKNTSKEQHKQQQSAHKNNGNYYPNFSSNTNHTQQNQNPSGSGYHASSKSRPVLMPRRSVNAVQCQVECETETEISEDEEMGIAAINLVCWNCEATGHRYQDCDSPVRRVFCYGCGKADTYKPSCKKCNSSKNWVARVQPKSARKQMSSKATNTD
ncbi:ubiquitin carboxyl-terminal hydrolase 14-like [Drosophila obscura]|uniref:ubiquitin carboxyl-terminal hydrolase 14-like n=1 Tax=Drosophila obscura TaxID=7282 RepID=UPI001BB0D9DF|nr:ubiquitin carboxyl-terminal hydrolase 14-like [Drosophila obscura]